jgi:hypothetical protein
MICFSVCDLSNANYHYLKTTDYYRQKKWK